MNLFSLFTLMLSLNPKISIVPENTSVETVYDENSSLTEELVKIADVKEQLLTATHEDLERAKVVVVINKSSIGSTAQVMSVYIDGNLTHQWFVSTGREQLEQAKNGRIYSTITPVGYFRPLRMEENHYSQTWKANMPHAVFFIGGIAVHASPHLDQLGKRASGGCVRLDSKNAATFFELMKSTEIKKVPKINRAGKRMLDEKGNPIMINSWDVLIIVENHA